MEYSILVIQHLKNLRNNSKTYVKRPLKTDKTKVLMANDS